VIFFSVVDYYWKKNIGKEGVITNSKIRGHIGPILPGPPGVW